jgi:hypothetical protein
MIQRGWRDENAKPLNEKAEPLQEALSAIVELQPA